MTMICISDAHEVMQSLPLSDKKYVCMRCGARGSLHDMFYNSENRCVPHAESEGSGWTPMTGTDYFEQKSVTASRRRI